MREKAWMMLSKSFRQSLRELLKQHCSEKRMTLSDVDLPYGKMKNIEIEVECSKAPGDETKRIVKLTVSAEYTGDKSRDEYLKEHILLDDASLWIKPIKGRYTASYWLQKGSGEYYSADAIVEKTGTIPVDDIADNIAITWWGLR